MHPRLRTTVVLLAALIGVLVATTSGQAQTKTLLGRIVALDRRPVEGVRLRLVGLGEPIVLRSGEFSYEIPAATSAVTVELADSALAVIYPVDGRVPVPAGDERVTIVIGEPVTSTLTRALAERQRASEQLLAEYGVQRDAIGGLEQGIARILERLDLREADLRDEVRRKEGQAEVYPRITSVVEHYFLEARDLHTTSVGARPMIDELGQGAFGSIKDALLQYNAAYEELLTLRAGLESTVESLWQEGALARRDLAGVFDGIERLHREHILPLNEQLPVIQGALIAGRRRDASFREALDALDRVLPAYLRALTVTNEEAVRGLERLRPR